MILRLLGCMFLCFSFQVAQAQTIDISLYDVDHFPGGWSLAPEEVFYALNHCEYENTFRILEFGSGLSTYYLAELLREKGIPFEYHTFENDPDYIGEIDGVTFHQYDLPVLPLHASNQLLPLVANFTLPQLPLFDLVIVDGPHGIARSKWYEKFKPYTHPGTVILIDDFHHYKEFGKALDDNFDYETIIEYNQSPSWNIINDGLEIAENLKIEKTFKIVKLLNFEISAREE